MNFFAAMLGMGISTFALAQSPVDHPRPWWKDAVFYEIFTRSFQDSNADGKGDLQGIIDRLDYLRSASPNALGVDGIWLTPIFPSPSYHGYDATNFRDIQADFGDMAKFERLIDEAHRRGLKVILDIAVNHTSKLHPWFLDAPTGAHHDFYIWRSQDPHWPDPFTGQPWNTQNARWFASSKTSELFYGAFSASLPDLNWKNPLVLSEIEGLLRFWAIEKKVDGFRLDAVRYFVEGPNGESDTPETHLAIQAFVQKLKTEVRQKQNRELLFVGEAFTSLDKIAPYVNHPGELDLAFGFPLSFSLIDSLKSGIGTHFSQALQDVANRLKSPESLAPFITNHDLPRVASQLGNVQLEAKLKLAAIALLTLPGTPFIYYGEEIGLPQSPGMLPMPTRRKRDDRQIRAPMQWDNSLNRGFSENIKGPWTALASPEPSHETYPISVAGQTQQKNGILRTYQAMLRLRHREAGLKHGSLQVLLSPLPGLSAFARVSKTEVIITVLNFGTSSLNSANFKIFAANVMPGKTPATPLWGSAQVAASWIGSTLSVDLMNIAPLSGNVIKIVRSP